MIKSFIYACSAVLMLFAVPASAAAACDPDVTSCMNKSCQSNQIGVSRMDYGQKNIIVCLKGTDPSLPFVWKAMSGDNIQVPERMNLVHMKSAEAQTTIRNGTVTSTVIPVPADATYVSVYSFCRAVGTNSSTQATGYFGYGPIIVCRVEGVSDNQTLRVGSNTFLPLSGNITGIVFTTVSSGMTQVRDNDFIVSFYKNGVGRDVEGGLAQ